MNAGPNYYAVIPAHVRYAEHLSNFQKLLYWEITALSHKCGYCFAQTSYFCKLYGKSRPWISEVLSDMNKKWYINIEVMPEIWNQRKIYIGGCQENLTSLSGKTDKGLSGKTDKGLSGKTDNINNTSNNTTSISNKKNSPSSSWKKMK